MLVIGGKIVSGLVVFLVWCFGIICEFIYGLDGCIDVKVIWFDNFYRLLGMEWYWEIVEENRRINRFFFVKEGWGYNWCDMVQQQQSNGVPLR